MRTASVFDVLEQAKGDEQRDQVYYIDPPYVQKGDSLYPHYFKKEEHLRLKHLL